MIKSCKQCSVQFEITQDDLAFYGKVSPVFNGVKYQIPEPKLCPSCREQRRLTFRNERKLYNRKCDLTGKQIISMYSPDKPYKVYSHNEWWGEKWSPLDYGKDFDFSRPFFEQFQELLVTVPHFNLVIGNLTENADYNNYVDECKNCYLLLGWGERSENCMYGRIVVESENCMDVYYVYRSKYCYECIDIENCYQSCFLESCNNCSDSYFLKNCSGCKDCFACINLRQKQYCIFNVQYSKEEYFQKIQELKLTHSSLQKIKNRIQTFFQSQFYKYFQGTNIVASSGDYLRNCKNCISCFDTSYAEEVKYSTDCIKANNCMDCSVFGENNTEFSYECISYTSSYCAFCAGAWNSSNLLYCFNCINGVKDCFGCVSLHNKEQYCIFNKRYTKEEYEKLVPQIIEHMKKSTATAGQAGEWGEFFPISLSPFDYNETLAQDFFPLTETEVVSHNWKWKREEEMQSYIGPKVEIPDSINDVDESICSKILSCEVTGKPYKIIPQELAFYKKMNLPLPRRCPDQRHKDRLALRNPRKLWDRNCGNCGKGIQTTYSTDRPEKVFCEECYLKAVY